MREQKGEKLVSPTRSEEGCEIIDEICYDDFFHCAIIVFLNKRKINYLNYVVFRRNAFLIFELCVVGGGGGITMTNEF
jgi:hypothetical protein